MTTTRHFSYPYLYCIDAMPDKKIMIIIDGGGALQGEIDWLETASDSRRYMEGGEETTIKVPAL